MRTGKRILVADDEPPILEVTKLILTDNGYTVITALDGSEAIEKARCQLPDLILLDMIMPGMNGLQICDILKSDLKTQSIPLVMFSVLAGENARGEALRHGFAGYIVKPFTPEELLMEVQRRTNA